MNKMIKQKKGVNKKDKRASKRLDAVLPIMLPTGPAKTINVSAGGAYFELDTSDADLYSVGQDIPVWLHATHGSKDHSNQQLWIYSDAVVVRKEAVIVRKEMVVPGQTKKWGLGLMFSTNMDTILSTVNGYY